MLSLRSRATALPLPLLALGAMTASPPDLFAQDASAATVPPTDEPSFDVTVVEHRPLAGDSYRSKEVDLGPLGRRPAIDVPFAVYGVTQKLLQTQMIHETNEAMQLIPSLQMEARFGMEFGPPIVRGFEVDDNSENTRVDGMNVRADTALPIDAYESYEVLTGPAGSLYGPTYAGGMINATLKRPTEQAFTRLSLEQQGSRHSIVHADLGGRVGPDKLFGYRVNLVHAYGGQYAPGSDLERNLASIAFDARLPTGTTVEVLGTDYEYSQMGYPGGFTFGGSTGSTQLPAAPDPKRSGYGAPWAGMIADTRMLELGVHQAVTADLRFDAGVLHQWADREFHNVLTHTFSDDTGNYTTTYRQSGSRGDVLSNKVYLNATLTTGPLRHDLAMGTNGFRADAYSRPQVASGTSSLGPGSIDVPALGDEPGWLSPGARYQTSRITAQSAILNDTISFNSMVALMLSGSLGSIHTSNYNASGARTAQYDTTAKLSGAAALLLKPRSNMTAYANYADAIQPGETASACTGDATRDLTNCGQTLAPERSRQYELGFKWAILNRLDVSLAAFQIRRPFAYADATTRTFALEGAQRNRGLELAARGTAQKYLSLVGGLTLLDPKLDQTQSPDTTDKQVVGIPTVRGNVLLEGYLPWVPGLAIQGSLHGRNRVPGNAANTAWASGHLTVDLGIRYAYKTMGTLATASASVTNLTNQSYWASVRGSVSGDPAGSNSAFLGAPRMFRFGLALEM